MMVNSNDWYIPMGIKHDPKIEVRKRGLSCWPYELWGYCLKFRPLTFNMGQICLLSELEIDAGARTMPVEWLLADRWGGAGLIW